MPNYLKDRKERRGEGSAIPGCESSKREGATAHCGAHGTMIFIVIYLIAVIDIKNMSVG